MKTYRTLLILAALLGLVACSRSSSDAQSDLLAGYVAISSALAADDAKGAETAATTLAKEAKNAGDAALAAKADAVAKAGDIATARKQFVALSTAVEPRATGREGYVVMYCPMVDADWVQAKGDVRNPYYGKSMLTCGGPKEGTK
jgi:hypothetical protein